MKNILIACCLLLSKMGAAQTTFEWKVASTGQNTGERVVAVIDAGPVDQYEGVGIVGEVIDCSGNWGQALPKQTSFQMFLKLSGSFSYKIVQELKTPNIILRLRKVSDSIYHLTANCPNAHRAVRVNFEKIVGKPTVTLGNPDALNASGELLVSEPGYLTQFTGPVGVNTSAPDAELTVKGDIHAEEVKVDLNVPGPDYVFEENYPLRSLNETKAYVAQHKHLPGIPSSAEMQQNGVNLLEMNLKLLEKVEELTLHLIEQERKMEMLNREVQQLKTRRN